jgi:hypothetical protein
MNRRSSGGRHDVGDTPQEQLRGALAALLTLSELLGRIARRTNHLNDERLADEMRQSYAALSAAIDELDLLLDHAESLSN